MIRASLAVCLLLASAPSCPDLYSIATHGFTVPTVETATATAALDATGLRVTTQFTVKNPNPYPITLSGVDFQLSLQGQPVFTGVQADPQVPEHGQATLLLSGVVESASAAYRTMRGGQSESYTLSGVAHVNSPAGVPVDVEFAADGSFMVPANLPAP